MKLHENGTEFHEVSHEVSAIGGVELLVDVGQGLDQGLGVGKTARWDIYRPNCLHFQRITYPILRIVQTSPLILSKC
jgi:hypothetical protein